MTNRNRHKDEVIIKLSCNKDIIVIIILILKDRENLTTKRITINGDDQSQCHVLNTLQLSIPDLNWILIKVRFLLSLRLNGAY